MIVKKYARAPMVALFAIVGAALVGLARASDRSPVVLMPGYGGSKLEASWTDRDESSWGCERWPGWRTIWLDYSWALPGKLQCLLKMLELSVNSEEGSTSGQSRLEVRVKEPMKVESVEYLTDHTMLGFGYFNVISERLVKELGYVRNLDLYGAPYDFRLAPNQLKDYYERLMLTIRRAYLVATQKPVTLICHSMGCLNALYFLHTVDQEWKDTHIARLISIGAPWAGSSKALRVILLGVKIGLGQVTLIDALTLQKMSSSFPSTYFLLPREEVFRDTTLLEADSDENGIPEFYTGKDLARLMAERSNPRGAAMYNATKDLLDLGAPQVDVHCFWGKGVKTLGKLRYGGDFLSINEADYFDDGDGTVNVASGSYCTSWKDQQTKPVVGRAYSANHMDLLKDQELIGDIISLLK